MQIGWHSDDERQLVPGSPVFSLSWGATREFEVKPLEKSKLRAPSVNGARVRLDLQNGDLVVMGGNCQKTHAHCIRKSAAGDTSSGRRINFTFRCFKAEEEQRHVV